jgi:hypothetical protein
VTFKKMHDGHGWWVALKFCVKSVCKCRTLFVLLQGNSSL